MQKKTHIEKFQQDNIFGSCPAKSNQKQFITLLLLLLKYIFSFFFPIHIHKDHICILGLTSHIFPDCVL